MKNYPEEAKKILQAEMAFADTAAFHKELEEVLKGYQFNDFVISECDVQFLSLESIDPSIDTDCALTCYKTKDIPTEFREANCLLGILNAPHKDMMLFALPSIGVHVQPILITRKNTLKNKTKECHFFVKNVCITYKGNNDNTLEEDLKNRFTSEGKLFSFLGQIAQAAREVKKEMITPEDMTHIWRQLGLDLVNGSKQMTFVSLIEKARQTLVNILIDKNKNSCNPEIDLEQKLKTDKNEIYKRAERKGLIRSAAPFMEFQQIRDALRHPISIAKPTLPDDEYVCSVFDDMGSRLYGKNLCLWRDGKTVPKRSESLMNVRPFTSDKIMTLSAANSCVEMVDATNRFMAEIVSRQDQAKQKIQRKKQVQRLLSMGLISAEQKQTLENTIQQRNGVSHGHAENSDIKRIANNVDVVATIYNHLLRKFNY